MESTFTGIGVIAVILVILFIYLSFQEKKKIDTVKFKEFLKLGDEEERFKSSCGKYFDSEYEYEQALRKFYSDEENYNRAQKLMDEYEKWEKEIEEKKEKRIYYKKSLFIPI
jgi:hypothetical protein